MTTFNITSGKIRVTDPCYDRDTWCTGVLENCANGQWIASTEMCEDTGWGRRVSELVICHSTLSPVGDWIESDIVAGVDSGQCGFFDDALYPEDTDEGSFYDRVCEGTRGQAHTREVQSYSDDLLVLLIDLEAHPATAESLRNRTRKETYYLYDGIANIDFGVATCSGYGDGSYPVYYAVDASGQIVAAKLVYISDDDEEEEYDDEYGYEDSEEDSTEL